MELTHDLPLMGPGLRPFDPGVEGAPMLDLAAAILAAADPRPDAADPPPNAATRPQRGAAADASG